MAASGQIGADQRKSSGTAAEAPALGIDHAFGP
jgi:hypothetical protein